MTAINSTIHSVLIDPTLAKRLQRSARGDEDAVQAALLELAERITARPEIAAQSIGYRVKLAKWAAQHYFEKARWYDKFVADEPQVVDDDGNPVSAFDELIAGPTATPEQILLRREAAAELRQRLSRLHLTRRQRRVAEMLAAGLTTSDVAAEMGTSVGAVCQHVRRMRAKLSPLAEGGQS